MKKYIALLIIVGGLSSFIRCKSDNVSADKKETIANKHFTSTLDSLQGTWVSANDSLYSINITSNTIKDYYDGQLNSTAPFFMADSCTNTALSSYNQTQVNGRCLIQFTTGSTNYDFCYTIGYLSDTSLEWYYDGKHLTFHKQ